MTLLLLNQGSVHSFQFLRCSVVFFLNLDFVTPEKKPDALAAAAAVPKRTLSFDVAEEKQRQHPVTFDNEASAAAVIIRKKTYSLPKLLITHPSNPTQKEVEYYVYARGKLLDATHTKACHKVKVQLLRRRKFLSALERHTDDMFVL